MHRIVMILAAVLAMETLALAGEPPVAPVSATPTAEGGGATTAAKPGELGRLADQPMVVLKALGGRVMLKVPAAAKVQPRDAPNAVAAALVDAEETRIILDADRERMILLVTETFTTADKDFGKAVAKLFTDGSAEPMAKDAPALSKAEGEEPRSYLVIPKKPRPGATLAAMALLVMPDKTVVEVAAYVNAEARKDLPGATRLAESILRSAAAGDVPLDRKGGVRRVPLEFRQRLVATLPPDWVMTVSDGPGDAVVYSVRPIDVFGRYPPVLAIYVGEYPSYLHARMPESVKKGEKAEPKPEFKQADGPFLGAKQRWFTWTTGLGADARQHAEVMSDAGGRLVVHVHGAAETDAEMQAMRKIADTMKIDGTVNRPWPEGDVMPPPPPAKTGS
jgi:hypothetical protein